MLRMIDGVLFQVRKSDTVLRVTARELGEHREVSVSAPLEMVEFDAPEPIMQYWREKLAEPMSREKKRELAEANRVRSTRRRVVGIRRAVKAQGGDTLLTGSFRALVTDLGLCWRLWKEFVRRVRRVMPGFSYTVIWERQTRGAWHFHAAVRRIASTLVVGGQAFKSYNLLRSIWRSVTGDLGGNIDLAKGKRRRSPARVASYLAKYMAKSMASAPEGANLYSKSFVDIPAPVRIDFNREQLGDVATFAAEWACEGRFALCSGWIAPWGDTMYFAGERLQVDRSIHWVQ
jgi:hypothetical protein